MKKFTEFNLYSDILKGIEKAGYVHCTPVQEQTFEYSLNERDVLVQSQTGTGKTAAFLISIFQIFHQNEKMKERTALIIVPTRELAVQIEKEAMILNANIGYGIGSFYGGVGYTAQEKMLRENVKIIIGTPGRLIDLNQSGKLDFKKIGILVVDEADRLFDMGFYPDIRRMLRKMPPSSERVTMLLSATISGRVRTLAWEYMNNAAEVAIEPEQVTVEKITHELYHVAGKEKMSLLLGILKRDNPKNGIIFTNTKQAAYEVAHRLEANGVQCEYIIGDLPQSKRLRIIESVKSGKTPFLVATDVAARGLHIDNLEIVIHYDLPQEAENYVHRSGRTARLGKSGKAVAMACEQYVYSLEDIEAFIHMKLPVSWADESMLLEDKSAGMRFRLEREQTGTRGRYERGEKRGRTEKRDGTSHRKQAAPGKPAAKPTAGPVASEEVKKNKNRKKTGMPAATAAAVETNVQKRRHGEVTAAKAKPASKKHAPAAGKVLTSSGSKGQTRRPARKKDIKDRLDYYSQKYGETFTADAGLIKKEQQKKKSPLAAVKNIVRRIFRRDTDA